MKNSLVFKRIRYKNLLSTGNIWTEIDLEAYAMTLVVGKNGDGKSTLIDAVCYALFNRPFRKINKPQLINSITKKELAVELEFEARGVAYRVVRGMKPAVFEIWRGDALVNQDAAAKDYQVELEKRILRTNFKTFTQVAILGSASYVPFMQLATRDRREIVEDLYDLRIFTAMNSILRDRVSTVERELDALEKKRTLLEKELELSRAHQEVRSGDKQKQIEAKLAQIGLIEAEVLKTHLMMDAISAENAVLEPVIAEGKKLDKKLTELYDLKNRISAKAGAVRSEMEFLERNDDCPTCKQTILPGFKSAAMTEKGAKLDEVNDGLAQLGAKLEEAIDLRDSKTYASTKHAANKTELYVLQSKVANFRFQVTAIRKEVASLEVEQEGIVDEAALVELENEVLEKKRLRAELLTGLNEMEYVSVLLKDTGIKSRIIKKYSGTFNELVNAYLAKLDFFVDFHLDESFEETIKSRGRDSFSYNSFSEGEKLRIDLAILFAWKDIARKRASLNTNLLIMDEIFDGSMDAEGKRELLSIMKSITGDSNVFVISHQTDLISDHFDRTLEFSKNRGFSKIVQ